jgi:hypothetical protein
MMEGKRKEKEDYNQQSELGERSGEVKSRSRTGSHNAAIENKKQSVDDLFRLGWFDRQTARRAPLR